MKYIKIRILSGVRKEFSLLFVLFFIMNAYAIENNYSAINAGMANAYSAISGDINSLNVNPAGISDIKGAETNASFGKLYSGLSDDSSISEGNINFVSNLKYGVAGFSWNELRLSGAYSESVFNLSFSTSIYKNLSNGLSIKYFRKSYDKDEYTVSDPLFSKGYSKSAIGFDFGSLYRYKDYSFSWVIKNINQPDIALDSGDKISIINVFGIAYYIRNSIIDMDISISDRRKDISIGIQNQINSKFSFRGGINIGNNSERLIAAGLGWDLNNFSLDYSFSLPLGGINNSGGIHRISLGLKFFKPKGYLESDIEAQNLRKDLENKIRELKEMQSKYDYKQNQIYELEKKINAQNELIKSMKETVKVEKVYIATSTTDISIFEKEINALRRELEDAKKEKLELKEKINNLEKAIKLKKEEPKVIIKKEEKNIYVVQKGDTLESIARKVYNDSSKWVDIYKANQKNIGREGEVQEGQILIIP